MSFSIQNHPIDTATAHAALQAHDCGGFVFFEGRVRNRHEGRPVKALHYEAYRELAEKEGRRLVEEIAARHGVRAAAVHAVGELQLGDLAVWVGAAAAHREAAFAACRELIDAIKERVPIWKHEFYADGQEGWIDGNLPGPVQEVQIQIHDIWISPGHDFRGRHGLGRENHGIERVEMVECKAGRGIVGDRYFDENPGGKSQITFFSKEVVGALEAALELGGIDPSVLRRNVLVSGVDLNRLIGRRFCLGGVWFEGVEECKPCYWMDEAVGAGALAFLAGRGGLRCRILADGVLRCGNAVLSGIG